MCQEEDLGKEVSSRLNTDKMEETKNRKNQFDDSTYQ